MTIENRDRYKEKKHREGKKKTVQDREMATFHSLSPLLLFLLTEQQCKVCAVSVIVSVKTFIMIMTNNDDDDYIHDFVYIPRPYPLLHVPPCIQI